MVSFLKGLFGGAPKKQVKVAPFGTHFYIPSGQTLLEAALANQVAFPHNCTVGTCGSCKCRLATGRVKAITDFGYTLSRQELEAGYILACQAVPLDEQTVVELEDGALDLPAPEPFQARITAQEALTHDIVRVTMELDRPIGYLAGQYLSVHLEDAPAPRCYSFADAPERAGRRSVSFIIRRVPGGRFTGELFAGGLADRSLAVDGPHGNFRLRTSLKPMLCIAGGSGLAPLLAILEDARRKRVGRRCAVLFGARTQSDLYAVDQLRTIAQGWQGRFEFLPVLSAEPDPSNWTGLRGMVTDVIAEALPDLDVATAETYMCGPPAMIDAAVALLNGKGQALADIHYDKFTDQSHAATKA